MQYNKFQKFMSDCKVFVNRMDYYKVPDNMQFPLLENYIKGYLIDHQMQINLSRQHIREFIA